MIISVLIGFLVGFVLAIAPGPVGVSVIRLALRDDKRSGIMMGIGASLMDFIYCIIAMGFTTAIFSSVDSFFSSYPFAMLSFQGICVLGMIIYGLIQFKSPKPIVNSNSISTVKLSYYQRLSEKLQHGGPFLLGIAIALTNIANPTFLPSLTYTCLYVQHSRLIEISSLGTIGFSLGFGLGNFAWMYLLLRVLMHFKARFSAEFTYRIQKFAGLTMVGVGTYLGYRVILLTKWPEILRLILTF